MCKGETCKHLDYKTCYDNLKEIKSFLNKILFDLFNQLIDHMKEAQTKCIFICTTTALLLL